MLNVSGESVIVLQKMTWEMVKPFAMVSKTYFIKKPADCFTQRIKVAFNASINPRRYKGRGGCNFPYKVFLKLGRDDLV